MLMVSASGSEQNDLKPIFFFFFFPKEKNITLNLELLALPSISSLERSGMLEHHI